MLERGVCELAHSFFHLQLKCTETTTEKLVIWINFMARFASQNQDNLFGLMNYTFQRLVIVKGQGHCKRL